MCVEDSGSPKVKLGIFDELGLKILLWWPIPTKKRILIDWVSFFVLYHWESMSFD